MINVKQTGDGEICGETSHPDADMGMTPEPRDHVRVMLRAGFLQMSPRVVQLLLSRSILHTRLCGSGTRLVFFGEIMWTVLKWSISMSIYDVARRSPLLCKKPLLHGWKRGRFMYGWTQQ